MIKPKAPKPEETEYLGEELEEEDEEEEDPQLILDQIRETEVFMEGGINKIPDTYIAGLLKTYLAKNFCQNRGYVLDDFYDFLFTVVVILKIRVRPSLSIVDFRKRKIWIVLNNKYLTQIYPKVIKPTGSNGFVLAQVITVDISIKVFFSLKCS